MIGMVYKDILVLRKQMRFYLIFFGVYAVMAFAGILPPAILTTLLVLLGMMIPMSSFAFDDQARWEKYAVSTPAGRQGVVGGKYIFAVLCTLVGAVVVALLQVLLSLAVTQEEPLSQQLITTVGCIGVVLVFNAFLLPFLMKFGAEKARTIMMVLFVVIFGGGMLIITLANRGLSLPAPPVWVMNALPVVLALVAVGGYVISYFFSLGIMAKKEL